MPATYEFILMGLLHLPATLLLLTLLIPNRVANQHVTLFRSAVRFLAAFQIVVAASLFSAWMLGVIPNLNVVFIASSDPFPLAFATFYDGLSGLMLTLVAFVGWVICSYSIRYLDGEQTQGRYLRWTAFTIGAVSTMTISGNLAMFFVAWVLTSLGLHMLLLHYAERPAARRAAWTKFAISRVGDAALIIAIVLIYLEFGTLDFAALFASVKTLDETTTGLTVACFLLVIGAITKSAQFPLHTWLPLTMETPTPVSALMHAGIVNAGGYLVIRTSPLLAETPAALTTLAVIGGVTACFGAVVMITQSGVKNALAYSTIAQMGFMMLQCGLGAFSAAMLHIVAHSLYKAYAFLSSGSVITEATSIPRSTQASSPLGILSLVPMAALSILILMGSMLLFGLNPLTKPGGLLLGGVFCCALTFWLANALQAGNRRLVLPAIGIVVALCVVYSATYAATDAIVSGNLPKDAQPNFSIAVTSLFIVAFIGLFAIQWLSFSNSSTAKAWYVHASNGFYVDALCRRLATELSAFVYGRVRPRSPQEHV